MNERKVRRIAVIVAMSLFALAFLYFLSKYLRASDTFDWQGWSVRLLASGAIIASLLFLLFGILYLVRKEPEATDLFKNVVDSSRVIRLWKQAVVVNTGIPCVRYGWGRKESFVVFDERDVIVREELSFPDPSKETSDAFIRFEAEIRAGNRRGIYTVLLKTDLGEDWIVNNWNWRMTRVSSNRYGVSHQKYPLASAQDAQARLASRQLSAFQSGELDAEEMQYFQSLQSSIKSNGTASAVSSSKKGSVKKNESLSSAMERLDDEDEDDETVENDIEKFREDNK